MNVTYRTDKNILYIALEGRIDASNAAVAEEMIFNAKSENAGKNTVIDADALEYISSAGLRIILKLRKEEPRLAIINVAPEVYEVLDMTGFTDMITVEKAYKRMSVEGCEFLAKGANGAVYRYDDETIIKTYYSKDALPEILQERESAVKNDIEVFFSLPVFFFFLAALMAFLISFSVASGERDSTCSTSRTGSSEMPS